MQYIELTKFLFGMMALTFGSLALIIMLCLKIEDFPRVPFIIFFLIMVIFGGYLVSSAYLVYRQNNQKIQSCYKENYAFVYKGEKLDKKTTKMVLKQFKKFEANRYLLETDKKNKIAYIYYTINKGSDEYEKVQKMYQRGYRIVHNETAVKSQFEIDLLFSKMSETDGYHVKISDQQKTVTVVDP